MTTKTKINSKFVQTVTVIDPDTLAEVEVEIRKLETGPMVGLDCSFLAQTDDTPNSPYDSFGVITIPDDEEDHED
jgi:hypothetical protein